MRTYLFLFCAGFSFLGIAQTAIINGVILNENNQPIENVNITIENSLAGATTNSTGAFTLIVPAQAAFTLKFTAVNLQPIILKDLVLRKNEIFEFNAVMKMNIEQITTVVINRRNTREFAGVTTIEPPLLRKIPGAQPGVENLLKSLPGVISNNELSTQYGVRGGNYDENLVYINEIEVYRPFLIRSGQQEGLSFVNSDMVRNVEFSAGGFQAKYGDKLSSVLDIEYRRPAQFAGGVDASILGVNAYIESDAFAKAGTAILGLRYRDNSLLINSRETQVNTAPRFLDAQTYLTYRLSTKFELSFLGSIAINSFEFEPLDRQTNFGTVQEPRALVIDYQGREDDQYETYFGAFKGSYDVSEDLNLRFIASTYLAQEQEHYDIFAQYGLGRPNTNIGGDELGDVDFTTAIGSELEHGRNDLDALIVNLEQRGTYKVPSTKKDRDLIEWGIKYTYEDIRDRLREYTVIDSAGFSVRPPRPEFANDQPYTSFAGPLVPFTSVRADNDVQITRGQLFAQYSSRGYINNHEVYWNAGMRAHLWNVSGEGITSDSQAVFSPRGQVAIKPAWRATDMLFRLSGGLYYQPPIYRELRDQQGAVVPDVKAQKSVHVVAGNDWSFLWKGRPFKLTSEAYYKDMSDVNTYTLENVRIRYRANNEATAYAYGMDVRINGEFVPGTESWISLGYLKTEENLNDRGFIARPMDQRLKFAMLFQDYAPNIPNLKLYLNFNYNTGLPGGSPDFADPYDFQFRLKDYVRTDIGVNYVLQGEKRSSKTFSSFEEVTIGAEIYNLFDFQNTITNIWVRDVATSQQFAIPNFLTPRVFNVRLMARW